MSNLSLDELRSIAKVLGISTEGKSAEDLSALIKGVAQKPSAPSTSLSDPWDAMSKHFEEGRFTDCTIRVKIKEASDAAVPGRPAKRPRSSRRKATETEGSADGDHGVQVINAHALVLASRSPYFERAMGGEWRESQDRSFEVGVADETEYATFRRLIKLCYGTTFTKEGGRDLDVSELMRLIHVANAFECMDAVKQCTVALQGGELDWEGALQCLELTNMLKGVEGMEDLAKKAGDVLAKEVGPVDELFVPVQDYEEREDGGDVLGGLRLSEKVKDLSPTLFKALLSSNSLKVKTENEAFWLLLSWVEAQSEESEEGKQELFTRMAQGLRFHDMDPGYIVVMVSNHPRIIAAGLQGRVLADCLGHANMARRTPQQVDGFRRNSNIQLLMARAPLGKVTWTKEATFTASDIVTVTITGQSYVKKVGLIAGTPWKVKLSRKIDDKTHLVGLYTGPVFPPGWGYCGSTGAGLFLSYSLTAGAARSRTIAPVDDGSIRHWTDGRIVWGKTTEPWEEVFGRGSEWLRNGGLDVKVNITTCNDQGAHRRGI